jgi:hypothetical protein
MQKTKIAAEELAEMIRDGLAEEGHDVQVHPNPETGWHVAVISANYAEDAGISGLRRNASKLSPKHSSPTTHTTARHGA